MVFNASANAFTLSGSSVTVAVAAGITNFGTNPQTISLAGLNLLQANTQLNAAVGNLLINSSLTGNGFTVLGPDGTTRVTLTGSSSNTGASSVQNGGVLRIQNSFALGSKAAGLTVQDGGQCLRQPRRRDHDLRGHPEPVDFRRLPEPDDLPSLLELHDPARRLRRDHDRRRLHRPVRRSRLLRSA